MHAKATITLDRGYYLTVYKEWVCHVSKWKKWTIPIGITSVITAIFLLALTTIPRLVPFALALFGVGVIFDYFISRWRWMKQRLADKRFGETATIEFRDDGITHTGPFANGKILWEGIDSAIATLNDIFLRTLRSQIKKISKWMDDNDDKPGKTGKPRKSKYDQIGRKLRS